MFGGPGNVRFSTSSRGSDADLQDLLGGLFSQGGAAGSPYGGYGAPRRGSDLHASVTLGFREAVAGDTVTLTTSDGGRLTTRIPAGVQGRPTNSVARQGTPRRVRR